MAIKNLTRLPVVRNKKYQLHGLGSYVYMLNKYNITPTNAGPYQRQQYDGKLQKQNADGTSGDVYARQRSSMSWTDKLP